MVERQKVINNGKQVALLCTLWSLKTNDSSTIYILTALYSSLFQLPNPSAQYNILRAFHFMKVMQLLIK